MHGRLKVKTSAEKAEEKRKEREAKANLFKAGVKAAFHKRSIGDSDDEALAITGRLLVANPDVSTLWNYRREILTKRISEAADDKGVGSGDSSIEAADNPSDLGGSKVSIQKLYEHELELTAACLQRNIKSYCSWHQRRWIVKTFPGVDLKKELALCNQLLDVDERNFHCWDYRRFVCQAAKIDILEELGYTLTKIQQNFSNFSSWYYRSSLFAEASAQKLVNFKEVWEQEYELVQNAIFTDPTDQSAWFYHKWLASISFGDNLTGGFAKPTTASLSIQKVLVNRSCQFVVVYLNRAVADFPKSLLQSNAGSALEELEFRCVGNSLSNIWQATVKENTCSLAVIVDGQILDIDVSDPAKEIIVWEKKEVMSQSVLSLKEQNVTDLKSLHQMEPDNKWINLTLSSINSNEQLETLSSLRALDPLRDNFYRDQQSKQIIQQRSESLRESHSVEFQKLSLTSLYFTERLTHLRSLDLRNNNFTRLGKSFNSLVCLEYLFLDNNLVSAIEKGLELISLVGLSLKNNKIRRFENLSNLENCCRLDKVLMFGNPIAEEKSLQEQFASISVVDVDLEPVAKSTKVHFC